MNYKYEQKVLFKYCDPAGIVFFPRYAELLNDAVESFFSDVLSWPFEQMHPGSGVPTVRFSMEFGAPSFHGDHLNLQITVQNIGRTSLNLITNAVCQEETRFVADQTLVYVEAQGKPQLWPDEARTKLIKFMETNI
jgi:4-hydroxybenzoyl-CoA thioesterase